MLINFNSNLTAIFYLKYIKDSTCCSDNFVTLHHVKPFEAIKLSSIIEDENFDGTFKSMANQMMSFNNHINNRKNVNPDSNEKEI